MHISEKISQYMFSKIEYTLGNNRDVKKIRLKSTLRETAIDIVENSTKASDAYKIFRTSRPCWGFFKRAEEFKRFITCYKGNGYDKGFKESKFSAVNDRGKFCTINIIDCGDYFSYEAILKGKRGNILKERRFILNNKDNRVHPDTEKISANRVYYDPEPLEDRVKRLEKQNDVFREEVNPFSQYFQEEN